MHVLEIGRVEGSYGGGESKKETEGANQRKDLAKQEPGLPTEKYNIYGNNRKRNPETGFKSPRAEPYDAGGSLSVTYMA
jgi:hypothetical protein